MSSFWLSCLYDILGHSKYIILLAYVGMSFKCLDLFGCITSILFAKSMSLLFISYLFYCTIIAKKISMHKNKKKLYSPQTLGLLEAEWRLRFWVFSPEQH
jgi:hypothetical protein